MRLSSKTFHRRGTAVIEFTLASIVLTPLLLGTFIFGLKLVRAIQMQQITRDVGHMYVRGVDFRSAGSITVAQTLSSGFDLSASGTSEVVLSKIRLATQADCDAANPLTPGLPCTNLNQPVFLEQLTIGNSGGGPSNFGTPPVQSDQTVSGANLANNSSAKAQNFTSVLSLKSGEAAYVAEMINLTPDLNIPGFSGKPLIYTRSIY